MPSFPPLFQQLLNTVERKEVAESSGVEHHKKINNFEAVARQKKDRLHKKRGMECDLFK